MSCRQCEGIEKEFSEKYVRKELKKYRKKGVAKTTRMLLDALRKEGVKDLTLLDIGGGIGGIQHALLKNGVASAVNVDASRAYSEAAREEAERQGHDTRIEFYHGDFLAVAKDISTQDIVTLDRVICCFDEVEKLVGLSAERAGKYYGVIYPRDVWWIKGGFNSANFFLKLFKRDFQAFIHPTKLVEGIVKKIGLERRIYYATAGIWQVALFSR